MGKLRRWNAHITASASGPEYSPILDERGVSQRPRLAANLAYTTADVDFFEEYWKRHWEGLQETDGAKANLHLRLRNPKCDDVVDAFKEAGQWFDLHRTHPTWDGGDLIFSFAGHGMPGDGALCLEDGTLGPDEFMELLLSIARINNRGKRLRVNFSLDSCHSVHFCANF